jgi:hypothetical protein
MTAEPLLLASPDAVPVQGVMLPHGLLLRLSGGFGSRRDVPQDELNAGQPPIHRKFFASLLLPLVLLAALAAGRIRSYVTQGVRPGRMNTLAIWRR